MILKDVVQAFSADTRYSIERVDKPHNPIWWGCGPNNLLHWIQDEEVLCIQWQKKGIVIYIPADKD